MAQPDLDAFFDQLCSRYAWDFGALTIGPNLASCTNPPYSAADFFGFYPKFGGTVGNSDGTVTTGSPIVTSINTQNLAIGMAITGGLFPAGTIISSVDSSSQITLSQAALANGQQIGIYSAPLLPLAVINAYIALASASLIKARWQDTWYVAMGLYVAHFATLWLRSDGVTSSVPGKSAAAGLARGILVSKAAAGVSGGYEMTPGLEDWGSWNDTEYGKQLATFAKVIGMGPMWVW